MQDRFFSFGKTGPVIDPADAWIVVLGVDVHLQDAFLPPARK